MKKTVLLLILLLSFITGVYPIIEFGTMGSYAKAEAGLKEVKIGFFNVPPHLYLDEKTGQMKGAAYELLENHLAPAMKVKFVWDTKPTTIPRQVALLETNVEYASALLIYSPERARKLIFPDVLYASGKTALALLKSNKLEKITKVEDITGLTLGYANNAVISPFVKNEKIKLDLISASNFNEINFKKMLAKRIDAVYAPDKASLLFIMKQMNLEDQIKVLDLPEKPALYSAVFSQSLKDVADRYNKAIKELDGQQLYNKLLDKYIDTSKL